MIYDKIGNIDVYANLDDSLAQGLLFLKELSASALPCGKYTRSEDVYAVISEYKPSSDGEKGVFENHGEYTDIQFLSAGAEYIDVAAGDVTMTESYDRARDAEFGTAEDFVRLSMRQGRFCVLFPGEFHRPGVPAAGDGFVRKIVVKVKIKRQNVC